MAHSSFDELFLNDTPLLDVRAPCEFQRGYFPTSVNLPILDDKERELVGTCYKEQGQERAVELGHALLNGDKKDARIEGWSQFATTNPQGFLYCFRGGKRSHIAQQWLQDNNINYPLIDGGYKALRTHLLQTLEYYSLSLPLVLLSGKTGSGKTQLLPKLPCHIDLEQLANHRGSSFGSVLTKQPTNITFENALAIAMLKAAQQTPTQVYIEDEGTLIGRISIPETLRARMLKLPAVLLTTSIEKRVEVSEKDYIADLLTAYREAYGMADGLQRFIEHHKGALKKIHKRFGADNVKRSMKMFDDGISRLAADNSTCGFHPYIENLLTQYYDPMYEYQFKSKNRKVIFSGNAEAVAEWCNHQLTATK